MLAPVHHVIRCVHTPTHMILNVTRCIRSPEFLLQATVLRDLSDTHPSDLESQAYEESGGKDPP